MEKYYSIEIKPRFRDTDGLAHVNNSVYLTYLEVARTEWFLELFPDTNLKDFNFIIARVEIDYLLPITLKSNVIIKMWVSEIGNKSWVFRYDIYDKNTEIKYARAKTVQVLFDYENNKTIKLDDKTIELLSTIRN